MHVNRKTPCFQGLEFIMAKMFNSLLDNRDMGVTMDTADYIVIFGFFAFLGFLGFLAFSKSQSQPSYVVAPNYVQTPASLR